MKTRLYPILSVLVLTLTAPALAATGGTAAVALGSENTVYELRQGIYADLFPGGTAAEETAGVLALDVSRADGRRERRLVPGTETAEAESSQVMVYERESDSVYLFWETVVNGVHPNLYLTSFDGSEWGEVVELIGSPFARKGSLQLVTSRDASISPDTEGPEALTVLHVLWSEERPGTSVKRYAPIFIIGGSYLGWTPVYNLDAFFPSDAGTPENLVSPGIVNAIRADVGKNRRSVVIGFLNPASHRLATVEIELLPAELPSLADKIRAEILPLGQKHKTPIDLGEAVWEKILELGVGFHPATLIYMADRAQQTILAAGQDLTELTREDLAEIAEEVWQAIVEVGSTIGKNGLAEAGESRLIQIVPGDDSPGHLLKVSSVSDREAPEVGGEAQLWLSESGRDVLVTWEEGERIYYRESVGDGWSEPAFLEVSAELGRDRIYETLAERVRNR